MRFLIFNRITFHMLTISEKNVEKLVIIKNNEKVKVMMTLEPFLYINLFSTMLLLPLSAPHVLEPDLDLALIQAELLA